MLVTLMLGQTRKHCHMTLLHKRKICFLMFLWHKMRVAKLVWQNLTTFSCCCRCWLLVRKIKAKMDVKRKVVVAVLLLEGLNDEEEKKKTSCQLRQYYGTRANGLGWLYERACHRRHTSFTWKCLKVKIKATRLLYELPDCLVSSLCYHGSLKQPLRIRLSMEFINIELNLLTTSCQTRKHCHTT